MTIHFQVDWFCLTQLLWTLCQSWQPTMVWQYSVFFPIFVLDLCESSCSRERFYHVNFHNAHVDGRRNGAVPGDFSIILYNGELCVTDSEITPWGRRYCPSSFSFRCNWVWTQGAGRCPQTCPWQAKILHFASFCSLIKHQLHLNSQTSFISLTLPCVVMEQLLES